MVVWPNFSMSDKVTYRFFMGRKAMFDAKLAEGSTFSFNPQLTPLPAEDYLTFALRNCPQAYYRNRRAILIYLVPVKMFLGRMPRQAILDKYNLPEFADIANAVK